METTLNAEENNLLKQFTELLGQQGMGEQAKDFLELCRYVTGMQIQLNVITGELQGVREQLSQLQELQDFQGKIANTSDRQSKAKKSRVLVLRGQSVGCSKT